MINYLFTFRHLVILVPGECDFLSLPCCTKVLIEKKKEKNKTSDPKLQNIHHTPDFWSPNKIFHNYLCVFIIISALYLSYICFTCYHYINHCFMNVVRM